MATAGRAIHEVACRNDAFIVFHTAFEQESPFNFAMDVLRDDSARLSLEKYGRLFRLTVFI
jgi:hypothetical protein